MIDAQLVRWMESDDSARNRLAIGEVCNRSSRSGRVTFDAKWAKQAAAAIDRIARKEQLQAQDMAYLEALAPAKAAELASDICENVGADGQIPCDNCVTTFSAGGR